MLQSFSLALIVIFGVSLNQAVDVSFNTIDNSAAHMYAVIFVTIANQNK